MELPDDIWAAIAAARLGGADFETPRHEVRVVCRVSNMLPKQRVKYWTKTYWQRVRAEAGDGLRLSALARLYAWYELYQEEQETK